MKKEIDEFRLQKKLNKIKTKRKHILENLDKDSLKKLLRVYRILKDIPRSWILDGYTKEILEEYDKVLKDDIDFVSKLKRAT